MLIDSLHACAGAAPADVGVLRRAARRWLAEAVEDPDVAEDLVLALSEALENAVDHAFRDRRTGTMTLTATCDEGAVVICVVDDGRWQDSFDGPGYRGRGLALMRSLTDTVVVETGGAGTTVTLRRAVHAIASAPAGGPLPG